MNAVRESSVAFNNLAEPVRRPRAWPQSDGPGQRRRLPELATEAGGKAGGSLDHLLDVSVCVSAELGRATMTIADLLKLEVGSVVGLDRAVSEPVDLLVQGVLFAARRSRRHRRLLRHPHPRNPRPEARRQTVMLARAISHANHRTEGAATSQPQGRATRRLSPRSRAALGNGGMRPEP